nr:hypothetical protein Iba_chr09dCG16350 [Ipomoea batatas]
MKSPRERDYYVPAEQEGRQAQLNQEGTSVRPKETKSVNNLPGRKPPVCENVQVTSAGQARPNGPEKTSERGIHNQKGPAETQQHVKQSQTTQAAVNMQQQTEQRIMSPAVKQQQGARRGLFKGESSGLGRGVSSEGEDQNVQKDERWERSRKGKKVSVEKNKGTENVSSKAWSGRPPDETVRSYFRRGEQVPKPQGMSKEPFHEQENKSEKEEKQKEAKEAFHLVALGWVLLPLLVAAIGLAGHNAELCTARLAMQLRGEGIGGFGWKCLWSFEGLRPHSFYVQELGHDQKDPDQESNHENSVEENLELKEENANKINQEGESSSNSWEEVPEELLDEIKLLSIEIGEETGTQAKQNLREAIRMARKLYAIASKKNRGEMTELNAIGEENVTQKSGSHGGMMQPEVDQEKLENKTIGKELPEKPEAIRSQSDAETKATLEKAARGVSFAPELVADARKAGETGKASILSDVDQFGTGIDAVMPENKAVETKRCTSPKKVPESNGIPPVRGIDQEKPVFAEAKTTASNPGPNNVNTMKCKGPTVQMPNTQTNGYGGNKQVDENLTQRGRSMSRGRQSNQRRSQSNGSRQSKEGTRMRQPQKQFQQPNADRRTEHSQHFGAGRQTKQNLQASAGKQQELKKQETVTPVTPGSQPGVEKGKEKVGEEIRKENYDDPLEAEGGGTEVVTGKGGESSEEEEDYITRIYGKGYNAYQELGNIGDLEEGELEKIDKANLDPGEEASSESDAKDKDYDEQTRSQKKVEEMAKRGEGNAMRGGGSDVKGSNAHRRGGGLMMVVSAAGFHLEADLQVCSDDISCGACAVAVVCRRNVGFECCFGNEWLVGWCLVALLLCWASKANPVKNVELYIGCGCPMLEGVALPLHCLSPRAKGASWHNTRALVQGSSWGLRVVSLLGLGCGLQLHQLLQELDGTTWNMQEVENDVWSLGYVALVPWLDHASCLAVCGLVKMGLCLGANSACLSISPIQEKYFCNPKESSIKSKNI